MEPLQTQIDLVAKRMSGIASAVYEDFVDYRDGNYRLHKNNNQIFARMDALVMSLKLIYF